MSSPPTKLSSRFQFRSPLATDGVSVNRLIAACKPLDTNSLYCNLLQCTHFAETCVLAELDGEPAGFVSAYLKQNEPQTLFVWQIAVAEFARGQGLGKQLLNQLLARSACQHVTALETTITQSNQASWGLFQSLAKDYGCNTSEQTLFDKETHFDGQHDTEICLRLGPLSLQSP